MVNNKSDTGDLKIRACGNNSVPVQENGVWCGATFLIFQFPVTFLVSGYFSSFRLLFQFLPTFLVSIYFSSCRLLFFLVAGYFSFQLPVTFLVSGYFSSFRLLFQFPVTFLVSIYFSSCLLLFEINIYNIYSREVAYFAVNVE